MYFSMAAELASAARQNEALPADYYNSTLAPEPRCIELYISAAVHIYILYLLNNNKQPVFFFF